MVRHKPARARWMVVVSIIALIASSPAVALSSIASESGDAAKEGIIAVPLPPLDMSQPDPKPDGADDDGTGVGDDLDFGTKRGFGDGDSQTPISEPTIVEPTAPSTTLDRLDLPGAETTLPGAADLHQSHANGSMVGRPADIFYGDTDLPRPVRDLRLKLMDIAKSGDIEKLRPYLETGVNGTLLSFGDQESDPIDFLKRMSGDGEGVEVLAILLETLEAGHVHAEPGRDDEIYIWPYFAQVPLTTLTKPQMVELFELVTAGDYEEMKAFGAYNFYRVGISPAGRLEFFVAGD